VRGCAYGLFPAGFLFINLPQFRPPVDILAAPSVLLA
jgi:hypothetical protein